MTHRVMRGRAAIVLMAAVLLLSIVQVAPARAATFTANFAADAPGEPPTGWTSRWAPGYFAVQQDPARLVQGPSSSPRRLLSFDAADGATSPEVHAVLQVPADNAATSRFQVHLNGSGEAGSETSYYVEQVPVGSDGAAVQSLRIGKVVDGEIVDTVTATAPIAGGFERYEWYSLTFSRDGGALSATMWPFGEAEPALPTVTLVDPDPIPDGGAVGIGSGNAGTNPAYVDFAHFAVGTDGDDAPAPAAGLVDQPTVPTETVDGVTLDQDWGFATVSWTPSDENPALLTQYEVRRAPVDDSGTPVDAQSITVGVWRPNRYTYTEPSPTFADAGYIPGDTYGWSVRAVAGGGASPWSEWVIGETQAPPSPSDAYRTEFENDPDDWTSYEGEVAFTNRIVNTSDRVRVQLMGRTHLGRDINLFVIGDPPPARAEAAERSTTLLNCNVHGPEAGGREACFMMIRYLAFSDDAFVTDLLEETSVLVVPSMNGDGRAAGTRGNAHGNQDLNRDHSLLREPETLAVARVISEYDPEVAIDGHHYGDNNVGDLPLLWARNLAVQDELAGYTEDVLTLDYLFNEAEDAGWWPQPYPIGYNEETILRNTMGLKNIVGVLLESRSGGGPTRPNATSSGGPTNNNHNDRRHAYSHLWTYREMLQFTLASHDAVEAVQADAEAANTANEGPLVLHGARETDRRSPPDRAIAEGTIVDPAPCGYLISDEQYTERPPYTGEEDYSSFGLMPSAETRLAAHGIEVRETEDGIFVPLGQPERGLIALILDPAAPGQRENFADFGSYQGPFLYSGQAERVMACPPVDPGPGPGPTEEPTDPEPTEEPTDEPGPDPTDEPTDEPGPDPTDEPTEEPTDGPGPDPTDPPTAPSVTARLAGDGRIQTAIEVSQADFADGEASNVLLARADEYPDALAGTPLATALNAPLLINPPDSLDALVESEIARVMAPGGTIYLLGGEVALDATVESALVALGYEVQRVAGPSRIETGIAAATLLGNPEELLITTGYDFPDAMSAGAAAAARGGAVLLTTSDEPHPAVDAYLADTDVADDDVYAVGGPAARAYPASTAVFGETREGTAVKVADTFFDDPQTAGFARRDAFPDALAGGTHLGRIGAPLLLTYSDALAAESASYLTGTPSVTSAVIFGGDQAVDDTVLEAIRNLVED